MFELSASDIIHWNLVLSGLLFAIGLAGFFAKSNAIAAFMCVELMLNAANLALATFGFMLGNTTGAIIVLFVITLAAAEAGIGLAIFIALSRRSKSIEFGDAASMRG
jgi:NADH-quinone oxidoreductase subunit K